LTGGSSQVPVSGFRFSLSIDQVKATPRRQKSLSTTKKLPFKTGAKLNLTVSGQDLIASEARGMPRSRASAWRFSDADKATPC
jgi:hypothetical protein